MTVPTNNQSELLYKNKNWGKVKHKIDKWFSNYRTNQRYQAHSKSHTQKTLNIKTENRKKNLSQKSTPYKKGFLCKRYKREFLLSEQKVVRYGRTEVRDTKAALCCSRAPMTVLCRSPRGYEMRMECVWHKRRMICCKITRWYEQEDLV